MMVVRPGVWCGVVALALALVAGGGPARADLPLLAPDPAPVVFPTLAFDGVRTQFGAQLGVERNWDTHVNTYRLDLGGEYLWELGLGGYATVAASRSPDDTTLSNLELGALYRAAIGVAHLHLAARAGLVLPTGGEDVDSALHFASTAATRPTDLATAAPAATVLRLAVTPLYRWRRLFVRVDAGADLFLHVGGNSTGDRPAPWLHVDGAAGVAAGRFAGMLESNLLVRTDQGADDFFLLALTGQASFPTMTGWATPYATVSRPFGGLFDGTRTTSVMVGVRGSL